MNPELETLVLAFSGEEGLRPPSRALFIGAQPHPALKLWPDLTGWQPLKPLADAWDRAGFVRADTLPDGKWPVVLMLPGKSRAETLLGFAQAKDRLEPGGRIVTAMPNTAGASRFEKALAHAAGNITSIQKHKCRAFHAVDDGSWNRETLHVWRSLGGFHEITGTRYRTQAGIFSSDHIDPGSHLLGEMLPANLRGRVADLGAGWGYLSDVALTRCSGIERIDLFEADSRALECARHNLAAHQKDIRFHWHDVTSGLPETYDVILMNPPFHTGQNADVTLGRAFLTTAAAALKRNGGFHLVANRQLPYEPWLDSLDLAWRKVAENPSYKLLSGEKR